MSLKEKLQSLGLTDEHVTEVIEEVKKQTANLVKNQKPPEQKQPDTPPQQKEDEHTSAEIEKMKADLQKQIEENENLKTLVANNKEAEKIFQDKLEKLNQEKEELALKAKKAADKQTQDLQDEITRLKGRNDRIFGDYKRDKMWGILHNVAQDLHLKTPQFAANFLVNSKKFDLDVIEDEKGTIIDYVIKTGDMTYMDKELGKSKTRSFSGPKEITEAVRIMAEQDDEFKTIFPIMADIKGGTGVHGGKGSENVPLSKLSQAELLNIGSGGMIGKE